MAVYSHRQVGALCAELTNYVQLCRRSVGAYRTTLGITRTLSSAARGDEEHS